MQRIVFVFIIMIVGSCSKPEAVYKTISGNAFGTTFSISYQDEYQRDFTKDIDSIIYVMNKSLSTYLPNSDISKINKGDESVVIDENFKEVFDKSNRIYEETNGYFDPTVGVLVNAWGFGPEDFISEMSQHEIDSLMQNVGFDKVHILEGKIIKDAPHIYIDFNAIAKGFGIDLIGRFLEQQNCENYLVELGGEIRARGVNSKELIWRVGIEDPNLDGTRSFSRIIYLENEAMASSGNYRKYKVDRNGKKFVHTINSKTGYAVESNLLSATVVSQLDCADVDAYATAFMAMGYDKTRTFLEQRPDLKVFLIYVDEKGNTQTYTSRDLLIANR